jgi:hypothetical protein
MMGKTRTRKFDLTQYAPIGQTLSMNGGGPSAIGFSASPFLNHIQTLCRE